MNQKGRDFLEKKVMEVYKREVDLLKKPKAPSMISFFRDASAAGELIPLDPKVIKKNIKQALKDNLIEFERLSQYNRHTDWDDDAIQLSPWFIFEMPAEFKKAVDKFEEDRAEYNKKLTDLSSHKDNLIMKIQIGSDKMLAPIVDQVDSQGSLQIMNSRVLLIEDTTPASKQKQLK